MVERPAKHHRKANQKGQIHQAIQHDHRSCQYTWSTLRINYQRNSNEIQKVQQTRRQLCLEEIGKASWYGKNLSRKRSPGRRSIVLKARNLSSAMVYSYDPLILQWRFDFCLIFYILKFWLLSTFHVLNDKFMKIMVTLPYF